MLNLSNLCLVFVLHLCENKTEVIILFERKVRTPVCFLANVFSNSKSYFIFKDIVIYIIHLFIYF